MPLKPEKVTVKLPWIEGQWTLDDGQRKAAWELYVEVATRIAVQPLPAGRGLLREALSSLHALFGETRRILRSYGPEVAIPKRKGSLSFGVVAVDLLNQAIRPFLSEWHPRLLAHENQLSRGTSPVVHEQSWADNSACRAALEQTRNKVLAYADLLATASGVPQLHEPGKKAAGS